MRDIGRRWRVLIAATKACEIQRGVEAMTAEAISRAQTLPQLWQRLDDVARRTRSNTDKLFQGYQMGEIDLSTALMARRPTSRAIQWVNRLPPIDDHWSSRRHDR